MIAPIVLTLPYPISANRYWATRIVKSGSKQIAITYVTPEAKAYKAEVAQLCRIAGVCKCFEGRVRIDVQLYPNRPQDWQKRMRQQGDAWSDSVQCIDLDNANKVLLDSLKGIAIDDDKWVRKIVAERMEPDEDGARVVVSIMPLVTLQPQVPLFAPDLAAAVARHNAMQSEPF